MIEFEFKKYVKNFDILNILKGVEQDPIYHAEGDAFVHTKNVCDKLLLLNDFKELSNKDQNVLFLAAVFHDIGKAECTKVQEGKIVSPNHGAFGAKMFREYFYKHHPIDFYFREKVASLIKYHSRPLFFLGSKKQIIETSLNTDNKLLYILAKADLLGRIGSDAKNNLKLEENLEHFKEKALRENCFDHPYIKNIDVRNSFKVIMLSGLPYSGKDTYVKEKLPGYKIISLDEIREEFNISPEGSSDEVVNIAIERAKELLERKETFVWNATCITREIRDSLVKLFSFYGAITEIHYIETSYKEIQERMKVRSRFVPIEVINRMITKLDVPENSEGIVKYIMNLNGLERRC